MLYHQYWLLCIYRYSKQCVCVCVNNGNKSWQYEENRRTKSSKSDEFIMMASQH